MAFDETLGERVRVVRLGPEGAAQALERKHVRPMDFTGRPLKGMVYVAREGLDGAALDGWVERATSFARTLPPRAERGPRAVPALSNPARRPPFLAP